ncbi:YHS domain-containing (seleno)protein [Algicella marina]|uniref:YHS domain protein n=1 Tax=Algicella marina TaxID=2683284 RepID=A0A6P1SWU2_9RHOB|nr:YHS domain-containing (seleno)protein [Algicella marina]QHQ34130.1 YHS domain protein [Algicella marina]
MAPISRRTSMALMAGTLAVPRIARAESQYLDSQGRGLRGYDPVAYFKEEEAIPGLPSIQTEHDGAIWQFEFDGNQTAFEAEPEKFLPQYGGFCAEGISRGFKRVSDPTVWVMVNDKLYVHYSIEAQNRWAEGIRENIRQGDKNWPELREL